MGAEARHVESLADLEDAFKWAKTTDRTTVISIKTDACGKERDLPDTLRRGRAQHIEGNTQARHGIRGYILPGPPDGHEKTGGTVFDPVSARA